MAFVETYWGKIEIVWSQQLRVNLLKALIAVFRKLLWQKHSTLWSVVPLAMFSFGHDETLFITQVMICSRGIAIWEIIYSLARLGQANRSTFLPSMCKDAS